MIFIKELSKKQRWRIIGTVLLFPVAALIASVVLTIIWRLITLSFWRGALTISIIMAIVGIIILYKQKE